MVKTNLIVLAVIVVCATAQSTYTKVFSTSTVPFSYTYGPNYYLGALAAGRNLRITVHATGNPSFTLPPTSTELIVEDTATSTQVDCTSSGSNPSVHICPIITSTNYRLRFGYQLATGASRPFEFYTFLVVYYDPNGDLSVGNTNEQIIKQRTEVFRDKITRLIYMQPSTGTLQLSVFPGSTPGTVGLFPATPNGEYYIAVGNDNKLTLTSSTGNVNSYEATLTTGYYIIILTVPNGETNVQLTYQSYDYPCPFNSAYPD